MALSGGASPVEHAPYAANARKIFAAMINSAIRSRLT